MTVVTRHVVLDMVEGWQLGSDIDESLFRMSTDGIKTRMACRMRGVQVGDVTFRPQSDIVPFVSAEYGCLVSRGGTAGASGISRRSHLGKIESNQLAQLPCAPP